MTIPHLLIHEAGDNVAVAVVEGLSAGTSALCVNIEDNSDFTVDVSMDIPIGHKVALTHINAGDTAIKYGEDIGRFVADVKKGEHVHTHNLKTKRW